MALTDRISGYTAEVALKAPVVACTTANITLSGEQTIDGIAVVANDRVLVANQTDASENGIYDVSTTSWARSKDFNGSRDVVSGTRVYINQGTTYAGYEAQVTTSNTIEIGTSNIAFSFLLILDPDNAAAVATVATNIADIQNAEANAAAAAASASAAATSETNAAASAAEAATFNPALYRAVADAIDTADIADEAITSAKIADEAITQDKIDPSISFGSTTIGTNAEFTVNTGANTLSIGTSDGYANDDQVFLTSTTTLPAGLSASTVYYVVNVERLQCNCP